jgi:cobalt-zinc-cadmium efflux system membrane fusion protein
VNPLLFCSALLLSLAAGCRDASGASSGDPHPAPAVTAEAADKGRIEIDPALLASGRIKVSPVEKRRLDGEVLLAGDAAPAEDGEAEVGALVAGRVATLDVAEGDRVKRGQILARIDAPDAGRATAEVMVTRGRALVAARKLERQLVLEKQGATSQNAVDEARAEDQAARAELSAARTRAATVGAGEPGEGVVVRVAVRSPIDGVVVRRDAVLGGPVTMEKSLFRVVDPERLIVRARLPETRVPAVAVGAAATLRPRASGASGAAAAPPCEGVVASTFGVVDEATRTVPVRVRPLRPCPWLLPGAWVDVSVRAAAAPAESGPVGLFVVAEAVVDVRGTPTVFVATDKPGVFLPRAVRPGGTAGASLAIDAGLAEGERVVTAGALLLKGEMLRSILGGD